MRIINFIYKNEKYPIKYELLKEQSSYFSNFDEEFKTCTEFNIQLVDEFDSQQDFSLELIHNFIEYIEKQEINITQSNIYSLQYLSIKFHISKLIKKISEYLDNNYKELIDNFLQNYSEDQEIHIYQEELLSYHITEYIENENIQNLPINVLYRILNKYSILKDDLMSKTNNQATFKKRNKKNPKKKIIKSKFNKNKKLNKTKAKSNEKEKEEEKDFDDDDDDDQNEDEFKMIDFLIRIIESHGKESSILLEVIKMNKYEIEYFIEKVNEKQIDDEIDISIFKRIVIKYLCNQKCEMKLNEQKREEEYSKMKEEYEQKMENMKEYFNQQIETIQNEYDEKIEEINFKTKNIDFEINNIKTEKAKENDEIRMEIEEQIHKVNQNIEYNEINDKDRIEQIKKEIQQQKETIMTNLESETSLLFILINKNYIKNNKHDYIIYDHYDILKFLSKENLQSKQPIKIFDSIFVPKETTNFQEIILRPDNFGKEIKELGFHSNAIEMLYSNASFDFNELMKYCNNYSTIIFEIKRSSANFEIILNHIIKHKNEALNEHNKLLIKIIFDGQEIHKINKNKEMINLISFEPTINTINDNDFTDFSSLLEISIPPTIKTLKENCFSGCSSLKQVIIPDSITEISSNSFKDCSSLSDISIPQSVKALKEGCFSGCSSLKQIEIPNSITDIFDSVFENCILFSEITLPQSITKIRAKAFKGCSSLIKITIPETVLSIGQSSFSECSSLKKIKIQSKLKIIEDFTFYGCSKLKEINIPTSVT